MKNFANVQDNVIMLCKKNPACKLSYSVLVTNYWENFNSVEFCGGNKVFLVSPESICRAFRHLVHNGYIHLSDKEKRRRKALCEEVRSFFCEVN